MATALGLAAIVSGAQKATDTPAIITYTDPSSTGPIIRFYSDGLGSYIDGTNAVSAFFFPSGNAGLNTESSATRTLTLDLSAPLTSPAVGAPFPFNAGTAGSMTLSLSQQLLNSNGTCCQSGGLLGMAPGATGLSRIGLTFPDPQGRAYLWTIKWGSGVTDSAYTCNLYTTRSADGSYWTIDNIDPLLSSGTCAELDYQSTVKGKSGTLIVYGYFALPFQFVMQEKP
jgi:hypothetical protein